MTLFERIAEYLKRHDYATRRELIDALDSDPRRTGETLANAVKRGAIERILETPHRFRLIDAELKRTGVAPKTKPTDTWTPPPPLKEPRQWFHI